MLLHLALAAAAFASWFFVVKRHPPEFPPGPRFPLPVIGDLRSFVRTFTYTFDGIFARINSPFPSVDRDEGNLVPQVGEEIRRRRWTLGRDGQDCRTLQLRSHTGSTKIVRQCAFFDYNKNNLPFSFRRLVQRRSLLIGLPGLQLGCTNPTRTAAPLGLSLPMGKTGRSSAGSPCTR